MAGLSPGVISKLGEECDRPGDRRPEYDINISCRSFAFSQSRTKVSAGLTDVSGLAVEVFDLVYCSLSVLRCVFVLDIRKQSS